MEEEDEFNKPAFLSRLGAHISRVRRSKGYSQDRLCLEAGFARGTLSRIEAGLVDPKASTLYRIAEVLEIHPRRMLELANNASQ